MTRYDEDDDDDDEIDDEEMTEMTMTTRLGRWMTWILDDNGGDDDVFSYRLLVCTPNEQMMHQCIVQNRAVRAG